MSNVYVVDIAQIGGTYSYLGYKNALESSVVTGDAEDSDYPTVNAFDHRDDTEATTDAASGTHEYIFSFAQTENINYFGLLSKNGATCAASVKVEVFDLQVGAYVTVANFTMDRDGKPYTVFFGHDKTELYYQSSKVKVTLTLTSKLYIVAMHCGEAKLLPRTPSLGYQPGILASIDEVSSSETEGTNFVQQRRRHRGFQSKGSFNYIEMDDILEWWPDYMEHVLNGKGIFFSANNITPIDVIYGRQDPRKLTKPSYATSFHTTIEFEINGYA